MNGAPRAVLAPCGQSCTRGAEAGAHTHTPRLPSTAAACEVIQALGALRLLGTE